MGENSFLKELTPIEKGGKNAYGRVAPPEGIPLYLFEGPQHMLILRSKISCIGIIVHLYRNYPSIV